MTEKSNQLMKRLTNLTEWIIDFDMPIHERKKVKLMISDAVKELREENNKMSDADRINTGTQLYLLNAIVASSLKNEGLL